LIEGVFFISKKKVQTTVVYCKIEELEKFGYRRRQEQPQHKTVTLNDVSGHSDVVVLRHQLLIYPSNINLYNCVLGAV
jgi:hypothetical protein